LKGRRALFLTLVLRVVNAGGQVAISLILLKAYGSEAVGYFAIFLSNTMLASLVSRRGFDRTLTLFAVRPRASRYALPLFRSYARNIAWWTPLVGLLNLLIYHATIAQPPSIGTTVALFLAPTMVALSSLAAGYFTGSGKTVAATLQQPGFSVAVTAFVLSLCFLLGIALDVVATYFAVATCLALFGMQRLLRHTAATRSSSGTGDRATGRMYRMALHYSRRYLVINFFTTFSSVYFISFLALFVPNDAIGQFRVVERLALVIAFNLTFINIILPARAIGQRLANDHSQFDKAMRQTFLFQYATGFGIFLVYVVFTRQIMAWIEVYDLALYLLPLAAQLINALTGPVRVILMYMKGQRVLQVSAIVETFGSALLYWVLYRAYGMVGLAVAYFLAISLPNIILAGIVYARLGIVPLPFVSQAAGPRGTRN
jgi:O-antigen/teichoic acid export membrane protein